MRLLVSALVAAVVSLGWAPLAQATPSQLTFNDAGYPYYQLDADGDDEDNSMILTVRASDGHVFVSDTAGITDATSPADRCVALSDYAQVCDPGTDTMTKPSWRFSPAGGDNSLNVSRASSINTPNVHEFFGVFYTGGSGCDDFNAGALTLGIATAVTPGAAPAGCVQDITTSPLSGNTLITLVDSAGSNNVTGGEQSDDVELNLDGFSQGVQISEDGIANDGEKGDPDDNYRNIDLYELTTFDDTFRGDGRVEGNTGNDDLDASAYGASLLMGEAGNDRLVGSQFDDQLNGADGSNDVTGLDGNDTITTGINNDKVDAGPGNDPINVGAGNDTVTAGEGNDGVQAGEGINVVDLGPGDDTVLSSAGNDRLTGGDGNDTITSGAGDDTIDGGSGDDTLTAGDGNDPSVLGGDGRDTIAGGPGNDGLLSGGNNDDVITGDLGDDGLDGGFGDDRLDPGDGTDTVHAGPGDDILTDTKGPDLLDGGEGSLDAIAYGAYLPDGPLSLSLDDVANDGRAGEGDNLVGMESLTGGPKDDVITGNATENYLNGGDGGDKIDGGGAIDVLRGGWGNDTLTGRDDSLIRDDVGCNDGLGDTAIVDANDIAASDCETVDRSPAPPGVDPGTLSPAGIGGLAPAPTPAPAPGAGAGTAPDTTAPAVTVSRLPARITRRDLLRKGVTISAGADEAASLEVLLVGRTSKATLASVRDLTLAAGKLGLGAGMRKIKLRPKSRLLGRRSAMKLRVVVVATDAAGNRRTVTRTLRVGPKR